MKKVIEMLNKTKLVAIHETAPEAEIEAAVSVITAKLSEKDAQITAKEDEIKRLEKEAADAKTAGLKDRATTMVEAALSAKKIVADQKESYITLASASEDGYKATKSILDKMKGYQPVGARVTDATLSSKSKKELADLYETMHKEGTLEQLKADNKEDFNLVYEAKFNKKPKQD